jgi:hypothetical protein
MPKEFSIGKIKKYRYIYISFNYSMPYIKLLLTYKEWKNLLKFLNRTKSRKYLPKHKLQYAEFDMDTNLYRYSDARPIVYEWMSKLMVPMKIPRRIDKKSKKWFQRYKKQFEIDRKRSWEREKKHLKIKKEDAKRNLISKKVYIRKEGIVICMERKQFMRFREYCLNPNSLKKPSWIPACPKVKKLFKL